MRKFNSIEPIGSLYEQDTIKYKIKRDKGFANPLGVSETLNVVPLVEFISYCLNSNHYHFILRQIVEGGISEFMKRIGIGYTNYFNKKYNRSGGLFQGKFKAIEVKNYSHFLKLAAYVNCNYEVHKLGKAKDWVWSSYLDYIDKRSGTLCNKEIILNDFSNSLEFENFCKHVLPDIMKIKDLKKYLLE